MLEEKTNPHLVDTVRGLKTASREHEAPVWRAIAEQLEKPSSVWPSVNVGEIQRVADDEASLIVVPGKVLGAGYLDKDVDVAAWDFTSGAEDKIEDADGRCLTYDDAIEEFSSGEDVQVVG